VVHVSWPEARAASLRVRGLSRLPDLLATL
jgi:hypothetical protein